MNSRSPRTITIFIPCLMDALFPQTAINLSKLLRELGFPVVYPQKQTCCGQPAYNQGYFDEARLLAGRFLDIFEEAECLVCPSGSCTAMVKKYYLQLFENEPRRLEQARVMSEKIFEVTQFFNAFVPLEKIQASFPNRVTYHDSCHSSGILDIFEEPRRLLARVQGLELIEMAESKTCCGFGGLFSRRFPEVSQAIGEEKVKRIQDTGARWVISNDPGCLMQIQGHLNRLKLPIGVKHIVDIIGEK